MTCQVTDLLPREHFKNNTDETPAVEVVTGGQIHRRRLQDEETEVRGQPPSDSQSLNFLIHQGLSLLVGGLDRVGLRVAFIRVCVYNEGWF